MAKKDKLLKLAEDHLDGEQIKYSILGAYETDFMGKDTVKNGVFIATETRVVFYGKRMLGFDLEEYPFSNISSIETGKKTMGRYINFFASGNKVKMKWIQDKEIEEFLPFVKGKIGKKDSAASPIQETSAADEIRKYKALLDDGIISEEEFAQKKKELLGV